MKVSVITPDGFNQPKLIAEYLQKEKVSELISLPSMEVYTELEKYAEKHSLKLVWGDPIAKADKILFFWDGSLGTGNLTRAKKLNKKIKIIKYLLL